MERRESWKFFPDLIPGPTNNRGQRGEPVYTGWNEKNETSSKDLLHPEEWDEFDRFELGCGRSAENVEFSEKMAGWGCLLFIALTAIAGVIALLERLGM